MYDYVNNVSSDAINEQFGKKTEKNYVPKTMFDENNYLNLRLAKGEAQRVIKVRVLPAGPTAKTPFFCIKTHSLKVDKKIAKSGFKSFICLDDVNVNAHDEKTCPLCAKSQEYFTQANAEPKIIDPTTNKPKNSDKAKSLFKKAYEYQPKDTYITKVIERGHESEGVKYWRFNTHIGGDGPYELMTKLYEQYRDESIEAGDAVPYNIFDLANGRDIVITVSRKTKDINDDKTTISISVAGRPSPLSENVELANTWLSDTKSWRDMYGVKSAEYLSIIAEDKIPVWNKENGCYVGEARELRNNDTDEDEVRRTTIEATTPQQVATQAAQVVDNRATATSTPVDDGLPF